MSWHYLQEQEEVSWEGGCLDGAPCALLSLIPTRDPSSSRDSGTDTWTGSQSGMTSGRSMATRGAGMLTLSPAGSHAKTSAPPERALALKARDPACGDTWRGSFVRYDHDSSSWRTHQFSLLGGLESYSETWPRWGMMRGGACWELTTWAPPTSGIGSGSSPPAARWQTPTTAAARSGPAGLRNSDGFPMLSGQVAALEASGGTVTQRWPTPNARDWKDSGPTQGARKSPNLGVMVHWPTPREQMARRAQHHTESRGRSNLEEEVGASVPGGGRLNPSWVAWLMGWPIGWTASEPLGMDRFQRWLRLHGRS